MSSKFQVALNNLESLSRHSQCSLRDFSVKEGRLVASSGVLSRAWTYLESVFCPDATRARVEAVRAVFLANLDTLKLDPRSPEQAKTYAFLKREVIHLLAYSEEGVITELRDDLERLDVSYGDSDVKQSFDNLRTLAECSHLRLRNFSVNDRERLVATTSFLGRAWNVLEQHIFKRSGVIKRNRQISKLVFQNLLTLHSHTRHLSSEQTRGLEWNQRKIECFLRKDALEHNPLISQLSPVFEQHLYQAEEGWRPIKGRVTEFTEEIELEVTEANPIKAFLAGKKPSETHLYHTPNAGHGNRDFEAMCIFFSTQGKRILRALTGGFFFKFFNRNETDEQIYALDRRPSPSFNGDIEMEMLGHATTLIKINKKGQCFNLLTDPTFHDLNALIYPRKTEPACSVSELPRIDAVFITHDHRDHCDDDSLNELLRFQPTMLVPRGSRHFFEKVGFKHVIEMEWGEEVTFTQGKEEVKVTSVPSDHWSGRNGVDAKQASAHGAVVEGRVYVAGDTSKLDARVIQKIHRVFPRISTHVQPAGPNRPRGLLKATHMSFTQALLSYLQGAEALACAEGKHLWDDSNRYLQSLDFVLYHYNTFELAVDRYNEPGILWEQSLKYLTIETGYLSQVGVERLNREIPGVSGALKRAEANSEAIPAWAKKDLDEMVTMFGAEDMVRALMRARFPKIGEKVPVSAARVAAVARPFLVEAI